MDFKDKLKEIRKDWHADLKKIRGQADVHYSVFRAMKNRQLEANPENSDTIIREYNSTVNEIGDKMDRRTNAAFDLYTAKLKDLKPEYEIYKEELKRAPTPEVKEVAVEERSNEPAIFESYNTFRDNKGYIVIPKGKIGSQEAIVHAKGVLGMKRVDNVNFDYSIMNSNNNYEVFEVKINSTPAKDGFSKLIKKFKDPRIQPRSFKEMGLVSKLVPNSEVEIF